jgi:hypothetical protein
MDLRFSARFFPGVFPLYRGPRAKFVSVGSHAQEIVGASRGTFTTELGSHTSTAIRKVTILPFKSTEDLHLVACRKVLRWV